MGVKREDTATVTIMQSLILQYRQIPLHRGRLSERLEVINVEAILKQAAMSGLEVPASTCASLMLFSNALSRISGPARPSAPVMVLHL